MQLPSQTRCVQYCSCIQLHQSDHFLRISCIIDVQYVLHPFPPVNSYSYIIREFEQCRYCATVLVEAGLKGIKYLLPFKISEKVPSKTRSWRFRPKNNRYPESHLLSHFAVCYRPLACDEKCSTAKTISVTLSSLKVKLSSQADCETWSRSESYSSGEMDTPSKCELSPPDLKPCNTCLREGRIPSLRSSFHIYFWSGEEIHPDARNRLIPICRQEARLSRVPSSECPHNEPMK